MHLKNNTIQRIINSKNLFTIVRLCFQSVFILGWL